jgi:hypothetical protein
MCKNKIIDQIRCVVSACKPWEWYAATSSSFPTCEGEKKPKNSCDCHHNHLDNHSKRRVASIEWDLANCGWDLSETQTRSTQVVRASDCQCQKSQHSWVQSQHPPAQWNLRGGRWSSVGESIYKNTKKTHNISIATPVTPFLPPPCCTLAFAGNTWNVSRY